jgi:ubiquinone/menaquinone biosynthesis C-methylase UbiE
MIRDRYRPAEFDAERYSNDNLAFWTPILIRMGRVNDGNRVLDLGCATGGFTDAVAQASGAYLVGCDKSPAMLDHARIHRGGSAARWVCADAARLPWAPRSFDRVIASLVVHQLPDRTVALREVERVLTRTGLLLVRTVTPEAARQWIPNRFFPSVARAQEARMPAIGALVEQLGELGFDHIATETVVRLKPLVLADVEVACHRELADRYPFVGKSERDEGFARMREHWAARRGACVDAREFTLVIASRGLIAGRKRSTFPCSSQSAAVMPSA